MDKVYHASSPVVVRPSCHGTLLHMLFHKHRLDYFVIGFNVASLLLLGAFILNFLLKNPYEIPWSLIDLYLILLIFYASDKEIRRWRHQHQSVSHRGEYMTLTWIGTIVFMLLIEVLGGAERGYRVPHHMPLAVGGIAIIYFVTQYLKSEYRRGHRGS